MQRLLKLKINVTTKLLNLKSAIIFKARTPLYLPFWNNIHNQDNNPKRCNGSVERVFTKNHRIGCLKLKCKQKVCAIVFVSMFQQRGCSGLGLYWLGRWLQHLINSSSIVTYFWGYLLVSHLPWENLFHGQFGRETFNMWKLFSKLSWELPQLGSHSSNYQFFLSI